jgi:hypothetical protein
MWTFKKHILYCGRSVAIVEKIENWKKDTPKVNFPHKRVDWDLRNWKIKSHHTNFEFSRKLSSGWNEKLEATNSNVALFLVKLRKIHVVIDVYRIGWRSLKTCLATRTRGDSGENIYPEPFVYSKRQLNRGSH